MGERIKVERLEDAIKRCTYCTKPTGLVKMVGKVNKTNNTEMNVVVRKQDAFDKKGVPAILKDNEFEFYLRRGEYEFKFCSVPCVVKYMGYDK